MLRNISSNFCYKNYFSRSWLAYGMRQLSSQGILANEPRNVSGITNIRDSIQEKIKAMQQQQKQQPQSLLHSGEPSIYRVPQKLRDIDKKAYDPHVISIGPYHHGLPNLMAFEGVKWDSLNRIVGLSTASYKDELDRLLSALDSIESKMRECYSDNVGLCRDEFVKMMLLDGCFIVELFRELEQNKFMSSSLLPKRWMLPVVRRDLITLENQLPMMVLKTIFNETMSSKSPPHSIESSLEGLALNFFDPLMPRNKILRQHSIASITSGSQKNFNHLLHVLHSSITPEDNVTRGEEPHMYRPLTELTKAGIKVRLLWDKQPLEMRFDRGSVLRIPSLVLDNNTGSFLKNLIAYEQCHNDCNPDVTTYLFFLDKLINSGEDVAMLHYEGIIQHSLGSNKQASKLISDLCKDVEHDGKDSYLHELVAEINSHSGKRWVKIKSRLKQEYFGNMWVSISTLAALLLLYLTLLQASCDALESQKKKLHQSDGLWATLHMFLLDPIESFMIVKEITTNNFHRLVNADDDPDDHQPNDI